MTEKDLDYYKEKGHYNPIEAKRLGVPLRVSKSSFMGYLWCPRQYWWSYVQGIRGPATPEMERGTLVHDSLDEAYDLWEEGSLVDHFPESDDPAFAALAELEEARLKLWGEELFPPVEHEVHHEVYDPEHNIIMVGRIDAVFRHPDGGLVIGELKTGNMGDSKLSKTRKELCFYKRMADLLGWDEVTHFYYMTPDCDNGDLVQKLLGKKRNKPEVFLGTTQGLSIMEPVSKRSITAFEKSLSVAIDGMKTHDWSMKWNDFTCPVWCDFAVSCDEERLG